MKREVEGSSPPPLVSHLRGSLGQGVLQARVGIRVRVRVGVLGVGVPEGVVGLRQVSW